ncbi:SUMF1/EgtB/PvdO family nonheme iron enzyme, partial [bacterium]|nr:SUMF1/EgtB/PvdO family nonheme iron enzyme [bacterium]
MKHLLVLFSVLVIASFVLLFSGCDKDDDDDNNPSGPTNTSPEAPSNPTPANSAVNVSILTDLSWSCSDPDEDPLTYEVYFGTNPDPAPVSSNQSESTYQPATSLEYNTIYYWKIVAMDDHAHTTEGSVWSFTTASEGNQPPVAPHTPEPADGASEVSTNAILSWSCSDPDEDSLTYDVYFGTNSNPPLVNEDQAELEHDPGMLDSDTIYYWRVVAEDDHLNATDGSLWSFTTESTGPNWDPGDPPANPNHGDEWTAYMGIDQVPLEMVFIQGGTFMMGAQDDETDAGSSEYPRHEVILTEGFWMGACEVTQAQWEVVTGYENFEWPGNPDRPAERVSWNDIADDFLPVINATETGNPWRLPTEAEWEYACR